MSRRYAIVGGTDHFIALEQDDSAALVARREIVAGRIELDGRDDIGWKRGRQRWPRTTEHTSCAQYPL